MPDLTLAKLSIFTKTCTKRGRCTLWANVDYPVFPHTPIQLRLVLITCSLQFLFILAFKFQVLLHGPDADIL